MKISELFTILFCAFCFLSCDKDDVPVDQTLGKITCKIDGSDFVSLFTEVSMYPNSFSITGISGLTNVTFTTNESTVGTYPLNSPAGNDATMVLTTGGFSTSMANDPNSKLVITEINAKDSTITGSFSFTASSLTSTKKTIVTEGKLNKVKFVKKAQVGNGLSCKVDGSPFSVLFSESSYSFGKLSFGGQTLFFEKSMSIVMDANVTPGTYDLISGTKYYARYNTEDGSLNGYTSTSGKLIISEHNKSAKFVRGTFSFIAKDPSKPNDPAVTVTDGKLSFTYE
jgi:hypothetical protein